MYSECNDELELTKIELKEALNYCDGLYYKGCIILKGIDPIDYKSELTRLIGIEPTDNSLNPEWDHKSRYEWIIKDKYCRVADIYTMHDVEIHYGGDMSLLLDLFDSDVIITKH